MADLGTIRQDLGEIKGKLDLVLSGQRDQWGAHSKLEERVRTVEGRQHWYAGVAAVLAYFASHFPIWRT